MCDQFRGRKPGPGVSALVARVQCDSLLPAESDASGDRESGASPSEAPSVATSQLDLSNKEEEEEEVGTVGWGGPGLGAHLPWWVGM